MNRLRGKASNSIHKEVQDLFFLRETAKACLSVQLICFSLFFLCFSFFEPSEMLAFTLCVIAILSSLAPLYYLISKNRFYLIFSSISIFNIAPIWFLYLDEIFPTDDIHRFISPLVRIEAFFWISIFLAFVNIGYILFWTKIGYVSINFFSFLKHIHPKPKFFVIAAILSFVLPILSFYLYYGSFDLLWTAFAGGRSGSGSASGLIIQDSLGDSSSLMLPINWIWQSTVLFGSISYVLLRKKSFVVAVITLLLALIVVLNFFLNGSRGTMMFTSSPLLFFLFYYNWNKGIKFWIMITLVLLTIVAAMELQVRYRGNLLSVISDPMKAAKEEGFYYPTTINPSQAQRDNNLYMFCILLKGYPSKYAYEGFSDFFTILLNPIPRWIWPQKPVLIGAQDLSNQPSFILDGPLVMGTTSLTYSVVGEAYQACGFFGILIYSLVYAIFILLFDGIIYYANNKNVLNVGILGISIFLTFWSFRSFFAFVSFFYPFIFLVIFIKLITKIRFA